MVLKSWDLNSELRLIWVEKFDEAFNETVKSHFDHHYPMLRWRENLEANEEQAVKELNKKLSGRERINLAIYNGSQLVGWSYGWQGGLESASFYMANSCVIPEYRRQGLYTHLLQKVIELAQEYGFQSITSRHVAANNSVIIPKLKAGFKITGMELSEIYGNLVHLTYFNNDLRREAFEVRTGLCKPQSRPVKDLYL